MQPGIYNFTLRTRVDFDLTLTWYQGDADDVATDLTGYTGKAEVRRGDALPVATFQTTDGTMTLGGAAGTVALHMDASDTAALEAGSYSYDIVLTAPGGQKYALLGGVITIEEGVTQ